MGQHLVGRDDEASAPRAEPAMPPAAAPQPVSEFAKQRPVEPQPQPQPRHQPQVAAAPRRAGPAMEEDQYEIPAFLRRQAN